MHITSNPELDNLISKLPKSIKEGRSQKVISTWLKEPVSLPKIFEDAYNYHFKERINLHNRNKETDRITWIIRIMDILKLNDPNFKKLLKTDLSDSPSRRTLNRLKSWARSGESHVPHFKTLDQILMVYGYEPISPRLKNELNRYFTLCKSDGKKIVGLKEVGKTFRIPITAYFYHRALLEKEARRDLVLYTPFDHLSYSIDLLIPDPIKLKKS